MAKKLQQGDNVKFSPAVVKRVGGYASDMRGVILSIHPSGKTASVETFGTWTNEEGESVRGIPLANLVHDAATTTRKANPAPRSMRNIEKSAFQKGQYVGYGGGAVWHIRNYGKANWKATPQGNNKHSVFSCATLRDVSIQLETLSAKPMDAALTSARKENPIPAYIPDTYLSGAGKAWRVISQGMPLTTDRETPQAAIDAAVRAYPKIKIDNEYWDNETLEFVPVSHLHKRKANPATRKRAISRPSQVTKKAPSKRLVARRKVAAKKPVKGYFPNPRKAEKLVTLQIEIDRGNGWEFYTNFQHGKSHVRAITEMATDAAKHAAKMNPSWMVRVIKK